MAEPVVLLIIAGGLVAALTVGTIAWALHNIAHYSLILEELEHLAPQLRHTE